MDLGREVLEECIREVGARTCPVIFHSRDTKFLANELAANGLRPGFITNSDSRSIMQGCTGMYWEKSRSLLYSGEEDWASTSTGLLGSYSITKFDDFKAAMDEGLTLDSDPVEVLTAIFSLQNSEGFWSSEVRLRSFLKTDYSGDKLYVTVLNVIESLLTKLTCEGWNKEWFTYFYNKGKAYQAKDKNAS